MKSPWLRLASVLTAALAVSPSLFAQDPPAIPVAGLDSLRLRAPAQFLQSSARTPEELAGRGLLDRFQPLDDEDVNRGVSDEVFWLRARLVNEGGEAVDWILQGETSYLDNMTAFLSGPDQESRVIALSDRVPFPARPLDHRTLAFRHTTPPQAYTDLYLRMGYQEGKADALSLNVELARGEVFFATRAYENLFFGASYGSQLTLMVIAFVLAALVRRRVYLLYGLFLGSTILFWLALNGFGYQYVWPASPWWHNEGFHLIFLAYSLSALLFSREFLNTRQLFPRLDKGLLALLALGSAAVLLRLAGFYEPVLYLAACLIAALLILPVLGALAWRRGVAHAFWFMLAWLIYGGSLLLSLISAYTDLLHWGMEPLLFTQVGSMLEDLLLLFATARRVVFLDRERRQALALANTDALTGLGNRRMLRRHYELLKARFRQSCQPVFLILIDIDHFKHINDHYGHEAGDRVLVELAGILEEVSRSSDACVRYGGEEFAILLQAEDLAAAQGIAERIRRRFEGSPTRHGDTLIPHTLSIGLTTVFDAGRELGENEMMSRADEALYRSKAGGRNATMVAA